MSSENFQEDTYISNEGRKVPINSDNLGKKNKVNPWRKPMSNITLGFLFTLMTFNYLGLQHILPPIGVGLLYVGFRNIHKENKELHIAWIFSIANIVIYIFNLIHINTPLNVNLNIYPFKILFLTAFDVSFLFIFRKGLKKVFSKEDITPNKDPILRLIIWRILVVFCAYTGLGSLLLVFILLIVYYLYTFHSLNVLGDNLDGIDLQPSDVKTKLSNRNFVFGYIIGCALIFALCSVTSNHLRLDSSEFTPSVTSETRDILIDKGFPKDILMDISDDEVSLLEDAVYVDSSNTLFMFDPKEEKVESYPNVFTTNEIPGNNNLDATTVYITLNDGKMYAIEYFQWTDGGAYWHDGFSINATEDLELLNGRLLYENNGISYSAPIPRLKYDITTKSDWFGNNKQYDEITGAVNYPFGSHKQRGYVFYKLDIRVNVATGSNIVNYIHYNHPFRTPYVETEHSNIIFDKKLQQHSTNFRTKSSREAYK